MVAKETTSVRPKRLRNVVYVVGAGFSAGLGYPLTKSLLVEAWEWLDPDAQERLAQVIRFHHPAFDPERRTTFPDIEQLLSEIAVNLDLFEASRPLQGKLSPDDLRDIQRELLGCIGERFHEQYDRACETPWLADVVNRMHSENAAVISFNWDLVLDHLLFQDGLSARGYGLSPKLGSGPLLLKPHGSLNWYDAGQTRKVKVGKRTTIFSHKDSKKRIEAFLLPRGISSKIGRTYTPLIVPPTYLKSFEEPVLQRLWKHTTALLSTPKKMVFLGYSLPSADLHAQFILRCGFHNQLEGRIRTAQTRYQATGRADIEIVDPDQEAARRIEAVAGPGFSCTWLPGTIEDWIARH